MKMSKKLFDMIEKRVKPFDTPARRAMYEHYGKSRVCYIWQLYFMAALEDYASEYIIGDACEEEGIKSAHKETALKKMVKPYDGIKNYKPKTFNSIDELRRHTCACIQEFDTPARRKTYKKYGHDVRRYRYDIFRLMKMDDVVNEDIYAKAIEKFGFGGEFAATFEHMITDYEYAGEVHECSVTIY